MVSRKTGILVAVSAGLVLAALVTAALLVRVGEPGRPPNVVILILDTVRSDALGGRWEAGRVTPRIDEVAGEGTRFVSAWAPAPWTVPSHASLFTGLYPHRHHAVHGERLPLLSDSFLTLAERLESRGYETVGLTCNPWLHARGGMAQGFSTYVEVYKENPGHRDKGAKKAAELAIDWIERRAGEGRPFLLFINFFEPHLPYAPPATALEQIAPGRSGKIRKVFSVEEAEEHIAGRNVLSDERLADVRWLYMAEVAYVDEQAARVIDHLREAGELENTLLVITSDHGEHLGEHRLLGHEFSLYEPLLHVPLIVRYPGRFPAGATSDVPVSLVDVLPTVLDLLGTGEEGSALDGRSLLDLMEEGGGARPLMAEYFLPVMLVDEYWNRKCPGVDMSRYRVGLKSLRQDGFKFVLRGNGSEALYDLAGDPGETTNVADRFPDRTSRMRSALIEAAGRP